MGEMHENIESVDEAIKIWEGIPATRMNGIKSISVVVGEGWDSTEFEAVVGKRMDLEMPNQQEAPTVRPRRHR